MVSPFVGALTAPVEGTRHIVSSMSGVGPGASPDEVFRHALESAKNADFRTELQVTEIPAPSGLAPFSAAWSATVAPGGRDGEHGISRVVVLYDPVEPDAWSGPFRMVCFAKAPLDVSMSEDPFLPRVAWSWLMDALDHRAASFHREAGTSSTIVSTGFGELASDKVGAEIELRASWSPKSAELSSHLEAWSEFVCMLAGFPPLSEGVTPLHSGRLG